MATLVLLIVLAVGALWWWAGTDGSLATGLRWVAQSQPLSSEGATGSLRAGGQVRRLVWQQDDLTVEVNDVTLAWQPWSLLHRTLKLNRLSAARVRIDDQRTPSSTPAAPPSALGLPLKVALDAFSVDQLEFVGPPAWQASAIAGDYVYTGSAHQLQLANAQFADGRYRGRATLASDAPFQLDAAFSGTLSTPVPGSTTTLPLSFTASAKGPLTELSLAAVLQLQAGAATPAATTTTATTATTASAAASAAVDRTGPQATATARITPWATQPVVEGDASFRALDLAALWPSAPRTLLTGQASVRPTTVTAATSTAPASSTPTLAPASGGWLIEADITNALPGPWDRQRLPLESLQTQGEWRGGAAVVRSLTAGIGGGQLVASGEWLGTSSVSRAATVSAPVTAGPTTASPSVTTTGTTTVVRQDWQLKATLQDINPGALHTQFAALPISGRASARSAGDDIGFDVDLQAAAQASAPRAAPRRTATGNAIGQLRLRDASATGSWNAQQAGGTLVLSALRVRSDDAALQGNLEVQPAARGGKGRLTLEAPGMNAQVGGDIRPASGAGELSLQARDAQLALRWLQRLPGMPATVLDAAAAGRADVRLAWQGGWQDPALQGRLQVPSLDWRMAGSTPSGPATAVASRTAAGNAAPMTPAPSTSTATATAPLAATSTAAASTATTAVSSTAGTLKLRDLDASLNGKLSQAQIALKGRLETAGRRLALQLAADTTRLSSAAGPNKLEGLDRASWQALVKQLEIGVEDPALGAGAWRLATRGNTSLRWTPTATAGALDVGAGEAVLIAPTRTAASPSAAGMPAAQASATPSQALIQWQPATWRGGRLTTAGKLTGLPLAWIELVAGPQLAGAGLAGNLVFD
ncbi:MAG: hypothetical protein EOO25_11540, partial [Comamonadaceae bacterium]